jgi:tyrosine-protein kinase Etk/Wzc
MNEETLQAPAARDGESEVTLLDFAIILAKHKKLVLGLPIAAAIVAAVISLFMTNIYTATTRILPPQQNQSSASAMLAQLGALAGASPISLKSPNELYIGMLKSRTVADRLIQRFDLMKVYGAATLTATRAALQGATSMASGRDGLITVDVADTDPKRAAALANGYIDELYNLTQNLAVTEASQRRVFLENQLRSVKNALGQAELELKKTQESTGLIRLEDQGRAIIESVARLQAQLAAKQVQLSAMRSFATDQNPQLVFVERELAGLETQLAKVEREHKLGRGNILLPTGSIPQAGLEYVRKFRDVKYNETIFELLAKQFEMAKLDEARDASIVQVLDKAVEPETRSRPARGRIVITTALSFGVLAVIAAFLLEAFQRARTNPRQVQRLRLLWSSIIRK